MRTKRNLIVIATLISFVNVAVATEFRSPLIVERSPMRYLFEPWKKKDWKLNLWSEGYYRGANRAYLKHGTNATELSALFFNKSDFLLSEIFPNACVPMDSEYYSPFVAVGMLHPRITYEEKGLSLGGRLAYPVYKDKGRLGIRVQVPFRKIEIEREDLGDRDSNQLDDLVSGEIVTRDGNGGPAKDVWARAVRMDFLQAVPYTAEKRPMLTFGATGGVQYLNNIPNGDWTTILVPDNRSAVVVQSDVGVIPSSPDRYLGIHMDPFNVGATPNLLPTHLPSNGAVSDSKQYDFADATNYSSLNINNCSVDTSAAKAAASQLWITSAHNPGGTENAFTTASEKIWTTLDYALESYNANMFEWLEDNEYFLESATRAGMGDIDVDLFYEHKLTKELNGELMLGVRLPTGAGDSYYRNPYLPHLGNGGHYEIKLGGMLAWQPLSWMNIKLDGRFAFVLESTEHRCAAFKCAKIKNIGPKADADVSWEYLVASLDFNLFHPRTNAISYVVGYDFYYKTKDDISFKCCKMPSWLGKKISGDANEYTLDNGLAESHTEAIAHKLKLETSFRINQYFEIFCNCAYTFAGQNIPREMDCSAGFFVTF